MPMQWNEAWWILTFVHHHLSPTHRTPTQPGLVQTSQKSSGDACSLDCDPVQPETQIWASRVWENEQHTWVLQSFKKSAMKLKNKAWAGYAAHGNYPSTWDASARALGIPGQPWLRREFQGSMVSMAGLCLKDSKRERKRGSMICISLSVTTITQRHILI